MTSFTAGRHLHPGRHSPAPPTCPPTVLAAATWHDADDLRWAVRHWSTRIGVKVAQIHLRPMRRKWASISTAVRLTLNPELLNFPRDLGEYVIVHELVHLLAPNHGKLFKSFLLAYLPDWQARDQALRALTPPTKDDHPS